MKILKHIYYGLLIGISVIIPGLSGGTTALILGVYKNLMESAATFYNKPIKSFCYLLPFVTGGVIGIVICLKPIELIIKNYEVLLNYFVIGVIFGSVPSFIPHNEKTSFKKILLVITGAIPVFAQLYLSENLKYSGIIFDAFVAFLCAIALILPGISLTNVLICFGKYEQIISSLTSGRIKNIIIFIIFLIVETIVCIKIINHIYKKHTNSINCVLLGMVLASSIPLFKIIPSGVEILYCSLLFLSGFTVCFYFGRFKV